MNGREIMHERPEGVPEHWTRSANGCWHGDDSVAMPHRWTRDARLSHDARGLLAAIATFDDDELPTIEILSQHCSDSRSDVERHLDELNRLGYLVRHEDGRMAAKDPRASWLRESSRSSNHYVVKSYTFDLHSSACLFDYPDGRHLSVWVWMDGDEFEEDPDAARDAALETWRRVEVELRVSMGQNTGRGDPYVATDREDPEFRRDGWYINVRNRTN